MHDGKPTIAFLFLVYDRVMHPKNWKRFWQDAEEGEDYVIYSHIKNIKSDKTQDFLKTNRVRRVKTGWCEAGLVHAHQKLMDAALENPKVDHLILVSGECIPLRTFELLRRNLMNDPRSRVHFKGNHLIFKGRHDMMYHDQWMCLNRSDASYIMSKHGRKVLQQNLDEWNELDAQDQYLHSCYDEYLVGSVLRERYGETYKEEIRTQMFTYRLFDGPSPIRWTMKDLPDKLPHMRRNCFFGRKYDAESAKYILEIVHG